MYLLKENIVVDWKNYKNPNEAQCKIADYIGIDRCTLNRIINRKQLCSKPIALLLTIMNSGSDEIDKFFDYKEEVK